MIYIDLAKFKLFLGISIPLEIMFIILAFIYVKDDNYAKKFITEQTADGLKLTLQRLKFVKGSVRLLDGQNDVLDDIAKILRKNKHCHYLLVGHVNGIPGSDYDTRRQQSLSLGRAETVARELRRRNIPSNKIECEGRGCSELISENTFSELYAWKNRRVEIFIKSDPYY